jgi:hypothetical protein
MEFTNKEALRQLKFANSSELNGMIHDYPEDEREGRTDLEMLKNEVDYLLDKYHSSETVQNDELREARKILRLTRNGIPFEANWRTGELKAKYTKGEIQQAHDTVNEFRRLENLEKRLRCMKLR